MKFFSYLATLLLMVSCASKHPNSRTLSSVEKDLTGHYLGVADYKSPHKGPNKAAIRIYFHPTEGEPGKYTAVLVEYVDLLRMAPSYIISNKLPFIAKRVGFLNSISRNISAYEVNPGVKENTFELWPLSVEGDQIVAKKDGQPRILTLDESEGLKNVMEGATISSVNANEPKEIFFPKKDDKKRNGIQYGTAKLAYSKAKLDSTWRKNYLRGPYLSQYAKKDDVVLNLGKNDEGDTASFVINEKYGKGKGSRRERVFTNKKSAFLKGEFKAIEPRDGMFLLKATESDEKTASIVEGRIGLFIDVFDATKSLNQDVVEVAFINPADPEDFLMYYEHPDNGEGTKEGEAK